MAGLQNKGLFNNTLTELTSAELHVNKAQREDPEQNSTPPTEWMKKGPGCCGGAVRVQMCRNKHLQTLTS